jgi:hypothetical protein
MLADSIAFKARYRIVLASWLCLLVIAFAVEAKTAWFGPVRGIGSEVRAAKAQPADLPRIIEHGVVVPVSLHPVVPIANMAALLPERLTARILRPQSTPLSCLPAVSGSACFSPQFFFRPPPDLS